MMDSFSYNPEYLFGAHCYFGKEALADQVRDTNVAEFKDYPNSIFRSLGFQNDVDSLKQISSQNFNDIFINGENESKVPNCIPAVKNGSDAKNKHTTEQNVAFRIFSEEPPPMQPEEQPPMQPEEQPPMQPEEQPPMQPEEQPPMQPEEQPPMQPEEQPPMQPEEQPPMQPEEQPPMQPEEQPPMQPEEQPPMQPEEQPPMQPEEQPPMQPEEQPPMQPEEQPPMQPEEQPPMQPEEQPPMQPEEQPPMQPEEQPPMQPEEQPPMQPEEQPPMQPEEQPPMQPEEQPPMQPEEQPPMQPEEQPPMQPEEQPPMQPEEQPPMQPEEQPPMQPEEQPPMQPEEQPPMQPEEQPPMQPEEQPPILLVPIQNEMRPNNYLAASNQSENNSIGNLLCHSHQSQSYFDGQSKDNSCWSHIPVLSSCVNKSVNSSALDNEIVNQLTATRATTANASGYVSSDTTKNWQGNKAPNDEEGTSLMTQQNQQLSGAGQKQETAVELPPHPEFDFKRLYESMGFVSLQLQILVEFSNKCRFLNEERMFYFCAYRRECIAKLDSVIDDFLVYERKFLSNGDHSLDFFYKNKLLTKEFLEMYNSLMYWTEKAQGMWKILTLNEDKKLLFQTEDEKILFRRLILKDICCKLDGIFVVS